MGFAETLTAAHKCASRLWLRVDALWTAAQVSRCGSYSVARLQAFDAYCRVTSRKRVVAVCVLTPLPSLVFPILLECIPLTAPRLGWDASWNIWIRCTLTNTVLTMNFITQARQVLPDLEIARWRIACVAVCTGVSFAAVSALIAALWRFPIPFAFVVTSAPFGCLVLFFFVTLIGTKPFTQVQNLRKKLRQLCRVMMVQFTLITIYPVYSALFMWFSSEQQTIFLFTLPALKLAMKNLMAKTFVGSDLEDSIPEITVFSVEIFNSLYISACLQMANSAKTTTFIVIAIDVVQSIVMGRGVLKRSIITLKPHQHQHAEKSEAVVRASVCESCRQLRFLRGNVHSDEDLAALALAPLCAQASDCDGVDQKCLKQVFGTRGGNSIVPLSPIPCVHPSHQTSRSRDVRSLIIQQTRATLFNCEYLVLVEYIECVIPIVYAIYTSTLFYLPNAAFYPRIKPMTPEDLRSVQKHLGVYIALEVVSLLGLCLFLRLKLRFSALYLLAFVLETHMEMIQAKLFVWVMYSLTYGLEHAGSIRSFLSAVFSARTRLTLLPPLVWL